MNAQKGRALQEYFCPSDQSPKASIAHGAYPKPSFEFHPIIDKQIDSAINALAPLKAPGPNGIGNAIFKQCQNLLMPHLGPIFRATLSTQYYPEAWKESKTVVLRKPNKPDYTTPKAYRPIALLDSMSKIMLSCIARMLTIESERHNLLEKYQFGARPGCTTTDALHMLTSFVKDAWRKGDVAVGLFLDIKSVFPSVNHDVLIHDMRSRGIPIEITNWIRTKLDNHKARLAFDDHITEQLNLPTRIDQGCPLSLISYAFYNADLIRDKANRNMLKLLFHDNTVFLARDKTFEGAIKKLTKMMTGGDSTLDWAKSHHSIFEIDKTALICFTRCGQRAGRQANQIKPTPYREHP